MLSPYDIDNCMCIKTMVFTYAHELKSNFASWPLLLIIISAIPCVN